MLGWQNVPLAFDYMPHGYCYLWDRGLVCLHAISDSVIALSYYVIPLILFYFVRKRRDLPFNWMFVMFAVFILGCGTTHLMDVWTLWHADYWLSGWIKAVTAAVSAATAVLLLPLAPKALALPSPSQLASANKQLQDEIAERKRAEGELNQFFSISVDMLCITGFDGYFKRVNPAWEKTLGYSAEELTSKPYLEFVHPEDRSASAAAVDELYQGGKGSYFENRYLCRDGSYRWLAWSGATDLKKGLMYGAARDITKSKEDAAKLRQTEERFRLLVESVKDHAIFMLDPEGCVASWNSGAEQIKGYRADEIIGQHFSRFYSQEDVEQRKPEQELEVARAHGHCENEGWRVRKDGSRFWANSVITALKDDEGKLQGFVKVTRDFTDRKRFEEALEEKNKQLEAASRAKDCFLASMSHELRTPLNAIIGFTGILLMGLAGMLNEEQRKQLQKVRLSARHLLSLINDLLDLVKIESGEVTLSPAPVVCQQVVEQVCGTLEPLAQAKGLTLQTAVPEQDLTVITDRRSLNRILMNLGDNAIKFTEKGGVRIALEERQSDGTRWAEISVQDTGVGIAPKDQQRLFEVFEGAGAVDLASREAPKLGLHLSRKLAELLGGNIRLKSEHGKGSTFTLTLPADSRAALVNTMHTQDGNPSDNSTGDCASH